MRRRPPGTRWEREERTPRRTCQEEVGCSLEDRNSSPIERSFSTLLGRRSPERHRIDYVPRYWTRWTGTKLDFSGFTIMPRSRQRVRTVSRERRTASHDKACMSQSSRYQQRRIPIPWRNEDTGAITLVKTCGAVERPKPMAQN